MNTVTRTSRFPVLVLACAGTLGLASAAHAGDTGTARTDKYADVVVSYADLNLASAEGARALYARLSRAADRACGHTPKSRSLDQWMYYHACYDSTLDRAVEKIGSQNVHTLHAARTDSKVG